MKQAAGILFVSGSGKMLLMRRAMRADQDADCQGCWSIPGGGVEEGEDAEQAARREIREETGIADAGSLMYWTRRIRDGVDFTTFVAKAPEEFMPIVNDEHDTYQWTDRSFALTSTKLHPGLYVSLQRFDMDERDVAKAIIAGELTSPQYYTKHLMLIALRITGTGVSYRSQHKEYVWRDPALYMNDAFLERCQGLEIIFRHPKKTMLNTDEYKDRTVGSIFIPYLKSEDEEVWGIAKIRDMDAAALLEHEEMSTSPGVLCVGPKIEADDGRVMLLEDEPTLLDHLAILAPGEAGVWDKGQGLNGVESVDAEGAGVDMLDTVLRKVKINEIIHRI